MTVRSLRVLPERVAPSGRVAPWPDVILTQVYSSLAERSLQARIVAMRRNARLFAEISVAEGCGSRRGPAILDRYSFKGLDFNGDRGGFVIP